ncbi:MAG TPA: transcription termination/antitermination protein NusA [Candidatus Jorgensenbacteria bacterium]|nr:transcription termination/antitermination protein NusA [Candidatus Jorgensenbacteria bacterium]
MEMDLKTLSSAINQIAEDRGIEAEQVIEAIENALASAYKKEYRNKSEIIHAKFDLEKGDVLFFQIKTVVDPEEVRIIEEAEEVEGEKDTEKKSERAAEPEDDDKLLLRYNADRHIFIKEAQKIKKDIEVGDELTFPLEAREDFGRIAAQTAKQVVLQTIREAERSSIQREFADKEGEIVSGTVQRFERGHVYIDLGRAIGVMFQNESIPGEHYQSGQRMRFYVLAVQQEERRRPGIVLSRAHPDFILKLFELEVPEISEGTVEIKKIAREPGSRTKIAVISHQDGIDPVGSVVGQRGSRIMAVINELGNEKIDVIEWSEDTEEYIGNSLSPAKVKSVEAQARREATVLVAEDQLSLAIGRGGQNVRLAAKLTGWKIDVRSQSNPEETQEGGVAEAIKEEDTNTDIEVSEEKEEEESTDEKTTKT